MHLAQWPAEAGQGAATNGAGHPRTMAPDIKKSLHKSPISFLID